MVFIGSFVKGGECFEYGDIVIVGRVIDSIVDFGYFLCFIELIGECDGIGKIMW